MSFEVDTSALLSPNESTKSIPPSPSLPATSLYPGPFRDQDYYWDTVTFMVDDGTLFRVPSARFYKDSEFFRNKLPTVEDGIGLSDTSPIVLDGVSKTGFRAFLKILYPLDMDQDFAMPKVHWLSILKLSNMWSFHHIRTLAIQKLSNMDLRAQELISHGRMNGVREWLIQGYQAMVQAPDPISTEDAVAVGYKTAIKLIGIREPYTRHTCRGYYTPYDVRSSVEAIVQEELQCPTVIPAPGELNDFMAIIPSETPALMELDLPVSTRSPSFTHDVEEVVSLVAAKPSTWGGKKKKKK